MPFFILFGTILIVICLIVKHKLQWSTNSSCPNEIKDVKINHVAWKVLLALGIASFAVGTIGCLIMF